MVTGDFDLSGIGTVTHVEGDRVYGFGHPMFSLGACEFPMMTGYIHTVYPRASVSMKMGSPLKVVGVLDTDVSTGVAGRIGPKPDMLPMSVRVKTGRYCRAAAPTSVQIVREPNLLPIAGHGRPDQRHRHRGEPARGADRPDQARRSGSRGTTRSCSRDTLSGPRYTGPMGPRPCSARSPRSSTSWSATRWPRSGSSRSTARSRSAPGRTVAAIESVRLASDRVEPGQTLKAFVTLKPFKGERETVEVALPLPADFPEGTYEAIVCDLTNSLRRRFRNEPHLLEPRDLAGVHRGRSGSRPSPSGRRSSSTSRCPTAAWPSRARRCRTCPGSVRAVFASKQADPVAGDPLRPDRGRPTRPGSSRGRSRSGSRWSRTPGSRYR